ncbi:MAG: lamin tail domain-containing protein [Planctomycetota bacterium]
MRTSPGLVALALLIAAISAPAQVVINEVNTGVSADYVEIANLSASAVDLSGWRFLWFEDIQNPGGTVFTFPGTAGSGQVVLAPDEVLVLTDDPTAAQPLVPAGVMKLAFGFNVTWNSGEAGSALLADAAGNGIDYWAHGNPNLFLCPFEAATYLGLPTPSPTTAMWSGVASPLLGGVNSLDAHVRHGRVDTDSAADWTMLPDGDGSPGTLNRFQSLTDVDGLPPTATFTASATSGLSPLVVNFTNTSLGDCTLVSRTWDFDATGMFGAQTSGDHNVSHVFTTPAGTPPGASVTFDVILTLLDACGGANASMITTITVTEPVTIVPQSIGFAEDFEGPVSVNGTTADPAHGWDIRLPDPASRFQTVDPRSFSAGPLYADPTLNSGPTVAMFDSSANTVSARVDLVLHIDGDAIAQQVGSGEFRVRMWLYSNGDELDADDVIAFQDGVTPGNGVDRQGVSTGLAGLDGLLEVHLADWHAAVVSPQTWREVEFVFDAAFFAAHPTLATPGSGNAGDYRIIIRHRDDFGFASNDGLLLDRVRIYGPVVPGPGEGGLAGAARMDLNDATNANGNAVGTPGDEAGPFFTSATPGSPLVFVFEGEPNQPLLLIAGNLNPGAAAFPVGQLDIGGAIDPMNGIPTGISILADGNRPDFVNSLFNTTPSGTQVIQLTTPAFPPGFVTTLQAVMFNSVSVIRISNAIRFEIL